MPQKYRHIRPGRRFVLSVAAGALASACAVSRSSDELKATAGSAAQSGNVAGQLPGTVIFPGAGAGAFPPDGMPRPPDASVYPPGTVPIPPGAGASGYMDAGMQQQFPGTIVCPPKSCPDAYDGGADD